MSESKEIPGADEVYCRSCGEVIKEEAEICPNCGVRQKEEASVSEDVAEKPSKSRIGQTGWIGIGIISAVASLLFVPPVFGAVSMFSGYKIYKNWSEMKGIIIFILGGVFMIIGMIIGAAVM